MHQRQPEVETGRDVICAVREDANRQELPIRSRQVRVLETPLSMRSSEDGIRGLFEGCGSVESVHLVPASRAATIVYRDATSVKCLLARIIQLEENSVTTVPTNDLQPNADADEEPTTTQLHRCSGYIFFGYYRLHVEGEYYECDLLLETAATLAQPDDLQCDEDEGEGLAARKRSRSADGCAGEQKQAAAVPEILVMTFVPQTNWTGYRGAVNQAPQPLRITPFIIYQALRGVTFPKRIILLPNKTDQAAGAAATQRALVQVDSMDQAKLVRDAFHRLTLELVDGEGVRAKIMVFVKETWTAAGGGEEKRQHVLNVPVNTSTALCVTSTAVSHLGSIFERSTAADATEQAQNYLQPISESHSRLHSEVQRPLWLSSTAAPRRRDDDDDAVYIPRLGSEERRAKLPVAETVRWPISHSSEGSSRQMPEHDERHDYRNCDERSAPCRRADVQQLSASYEMPSYQASHAAPTSFRTRSPSAREPSRSSTVVPNNVGGSQQQFYTAPAVQAQPQTRLMPPGWSAVFSPEHQREYYVYECPYTGTMSTAWTLPK